LSSSLAAQADAQDQIDANVQEAGAGRHAGRQAGHLRHAGMHK